MTEFLKKLSAVWACTISKVLPKARKFQRILVLRGTKLLTCWDARAFWADTVNPHCCLGFYVFAAEAVKTRG
jgi:hypothetical protein